MIIRARSPQPPMTDRPRILVVEDEPSIADNLVYSLETEGFAVERCATGSEALARLAAEPASLVVLDVGLPDMSGFEVCKMIRKTSSVPVIFLTARAAEIDRVVGLEIGGDDYVVKPFSPRELTARVKAILRRADPSAAPTPSAQHFHIDEGRKQIAFHGQRLALSRNEYRLLRALYQHPGRVYSRAQLMDLAWDEPEAAMERTVDAHIKSLRAKLRAARPDLDPIETHRGLGYSLRESA